MGCINSKTGQVRTLSDETEEPLPASAFSQKGAAHAWLQEIGLAQYAPAFEQAGFSDWDLLSCLTEADLQAIVSHTGAVIPPGHRKKLLMASRQMGQSGQNGPVVAPTFGSARRYSHTSNPGNGHGSRGSGLVAAASSALDRRSTGRRPSGVASRVPSHHGTPGGERGGHGHGGRGATEDGMASGRRSRGPMNGLLASRNSSRNSLSGNAGGLVGYINSPSVSGPAGGGERSRPRSSGLAAAAAQAAMDDGQWERLDGQRPSPSEGPGGSPRTAGAAAVAAAAAVVAAGGAPSPQRQRRRWSVNKQASRGALVMAGPGPPGFTAVPTVPSAVAVAPGALGGPSGNSLGWLDSETAGPYSGVDWPGPDEGRAPSSSSVPVPNFGRQSSSELGGAGAGAGANAPSGANGVQTGGSYGGALGPAAGAMHQQHGRKGSVVAGPRGAQYYAPSQVLVTASSGGGEGPSQQKGTRGLAAAKPTALGRALSHAGGNDAVSASLPSAPSPIPPVAGMSGDRPARISAVDMGLRPHSPRAHAGPSASGPGWPSSPGPPHPTGSGGSDAPGPAAAAWGDGDSPPAAPAARNGGGGAGSALPRFVRALAGWAIPGGLGSSGGAASTPAGGAAGGKRRNSDREHANPAAPTHHVWRRKTSDAKGADAGLAAEKSGGGGNKSDREDAPPTPSGHSSQSTRSAMLKGGRSSRMMLVSESSGQRGHGPGWDQGPLVLHGRGGGQPRSATPSNAASAAAAAAAAAAADEAEGQATLEAMARGDLAAGPNGPTGPGPGAGSPGPRGGGWPFVMPHLPRVSGSGLPPSFSGALGAGPEDGAGGGGGPAPRGASPARADGTGAGVGGAPSPFNAVTSFSRLAPLPGMTPHHLALGAAGRGGGRSGANGLGAAAASDGAAAAEVLAAEADLPSFDSTPMPGRPHRVQIIHAGGLGSAVPPAAASASHSNLSHWPALPLHPPTRTRGAPSGPDSITGPSGGAPGAISPVTVANRAGALEILPPEPPGRTPAPAPPPQRPESGREPEATFAPGPSAPSGLPGPQPTPGRQLDLERLADQVSRIMAAMSDMTDGAALEGDTEAGVEDVARAGAGGGATVSEGGEEHHAAPGGGLQVIPPRRGATVSTLPDEFGGLGSRAERMQAMERRRLELQRLHRDLVTRVATLAAARGPGPQADTSSPNGPSAAGEGGAAEAPGAAAAAAAVAEVEERIRSKLAELADLTTAERSGGGGGGGGGTAHEGGGAHAPPLRSAPPGGGHGGDGGRRRGADEAALHEEVMAVLGARKRQARAAVASSAGAGVAGNGNGNGNGHGPPSLRDPLREELMAIEARIRARVHPPQP
ncbi:hypothetical protein HYH03_002570 [Edaphochlamys debaryana]|uniref:SAM domain-containing protein n=1 Tax=Edaphochlamys debaryana TaxID=47281 RepID=A0A836C3Z4_9CHLO|nr:hypothetical protein HYH03_002570 [Edaphochlamys debaryana]|eukprot:KAG2499631.1 hypothetical protein HYH03_002570 [Edaphochlamys debaryana]